MDLQPAVMERYTTHTRFCILANYTHKLTPAILSRCTRFRFSPISLSAIRSRISYVIENEGVKISSAGFDALLELSKGDMRRVLNVLQACYTASQTPDEVSEISEKDIFECVGSPDPEDIKLLLDTIMTEDWGTAVRTVSKVKRGKGLALVDILTSLAEEIERIQVKPATRIVWLEGLADVEYRLGSGGSEVLQTSAMIGVIKDGLELER